jgi:hypothetical protein
VRADGLARKRDGPGLRGVVQLVEENPAEGSELETEPYYPGAAQAASASSSSRSIREYPDLRWLARSRATL